jgi:hypothetical protein
MRRLDQVVRLCSRSLSAPGRTDLARVLLIVDGALALSNPVYAAFAERRHTGKWGRRLGFSNWVQSWREWNMERRMTENPPAAALLGWLERVLPGGSWEFRPIRAPGGGKPTPEDVEQMGG